MDIIFGKLDEGIGKHLDEVMSLDVGSSEMSNAVNNTAVLYKLRIEEEKLEIERKRMEMEQSKTEHQHTFDKEKLLIDTAIAGAELVLPLALYGVLSYIGYAREFDGCVTSDTLKRVLNSIRKK